MTRWIKLLLVGALIVVAAQLARLVSLSRWVAPGGADLTFEGPPRRGGHFSVTDAINALDDEPPIRNVSATRGGGSGGRFGTNAAMDTTISGGGRRFSTNATTVHGDEWKPLPWSLPKIDPNNHRTSREFMNQLGQLKRSMNISLPWNTTANFSLPTPAISLNLPKSATLTLSNFFKCGGYVGAHTHIPGTRPNLRIGDCVRDNFLSDTPPFQGCNIDNNTQEEVQFYSDVGIQEPRCFYSSIHDGGLEHIARHYPKATILMMPRPFEDWYKSILKWGTGRLLGRWKKICGFSVSGRKRGCEKDDKECWRTFYFAHTEKVRRFAVDHPELTYVELPLDEDAPSMLESYTGIPSSCFQHCVSGKPKDPNIDLRGYKKCRPITVDKENG